MISPQLVQAIRDQFKLNWKGIHGSSHWARVRESGLRLAAMTGANARVVETFSFVHDSCRWNDGKDPEHGHRAGEFARTLMGSVLNLVPDELELLVEACEGHSNGLTQANITVKTCWDADRLDLGRIGIRPDPTRLCTEAARDPELISWAYARSRMVWRPDIGLD